MHWLDWSIVLLYLGYIALSGIRLGRGASTLDSYLLAGRSMPWWAVGLSVMATQMSAITIVGTTGKAYEDGLRFIQFYFGLPLAMVLLCITLVPFFHRSGVYTAYQYLENRFDARTRTLAGLVFLLSRGLSCGVIIAAPSVILSLVLGWNEVLVILAIGLTTVLYTMVGGVRAVTWTDVRQMLIIVCSLIACALVLATTLPNSVSFLGALQLAGAADKMTAVDLNPSLSETYTLWSGLLAGTFLMLSYFGCDQSQVQRYLTTRSIDESRLSLMMSAVLKIPLQLLVLGLGVAVYVFYQFEQPPLIFEPSIAEELEASPNATSYTALSREFSANWLAKRAAAEALASNVDQRSLGTYKKLHGRETEIRAKALAMAAELRGKETYSDVNYIFPKFISSMLPIGMLGLMIAAIFAAAMSSVSSELSALASTSVIDIYKRHIHPSGDDAHYLRAARAFTILWGLFACGAAYYARDLGALIEVVNRFGSFFYGSLLGVFALALLSRRVNAAGAFYGLISGVLVVAFIDNLPWLASTTGSSALSIFSEYCQISFLWYNVIGSLTVVVVGASISMLSRGT